MTYEQVILDLLSAKVAEDIDKQFIKEVEEMCKTERYAGPLLNEKDANKKLQRMTKAELLKYIDNLKEITISRIDEVNRLTISQRGTLDTLRSAQSDAEFWKHLAFQFQGQVKELMTKISNVLQRSMSSKESSMSSKGLVDNRKHIRGYND